MNIKVCDRCGKRVKWAKRIECKTPVIMSIPFDTIGFDLCQSCFDEFKDFMTYKDEIDKQEFDKLLKGEYE